MSTVMGVVISLAQAFELEVSSVGMREKFIVVCFNWPREKCALEDLDSRRYEISGEFMEIAGSGREYTSKLTMADMTLTTLTGSARPDAGMSLFSRINRHASRIPS